MSDTTIKRIAIVVGVLFFLGIFAVQPVAAIVLGVIGGVAYYAYRERTREERKSEAEMLAYRLNLLNNVWRPMEGELAEVVRSGGAVTEADTVWRDVKNFARQESGATFDHSMGRYVNLRTRVALLASEQSVSEHSQRQLGSEQQKLLFISRDLLEQTRAAIQAMPVKSTPRSVPTPALRRPASTPTRKPLTIGQESRARPTSTPRPPASTPHRNPLRIGQESLTEPRTVTPREEPRLASRATAQRIEARPKTEPAPRPTPSPAARPVAQRIEAAPKVDPVPRPTPEFTASTVKPTTPPHPVEAPEPTADVPAVEPAAPLVPAPSVEEPQPAPKVPSGGLRLEAASVCDELFDPKLMSYETNRLFDERYKDQSVRWIGAVRRANEYSYDSTFGDEGGTKVEVDLHEIKQAYGNRIVKGFVQLRKEAIDDVRSRIGQDVAFEGRLLTCEGSSRRIYVADAKLANLVHLKQIAR